MRLARSFLSSSFFNCLLALLPVALCFLSIWTRASNLLVAAIVAACLLAARWAFKNEFSWSLAAMVFWTPLFITDLSSVAGSPLKFALVRSLFLVLVAFWLLKAAADGHLTLRRSPLNVVALLFVLATLLSVIGSANKWAWLTGFTNTGIVVGIYFLSAACLDTAQDAKRVMHGLVAAGTLAAIYGLLQAKGIDFFPWEQTPLRKILVAPSTFGQDNFGAYYIGLALPVAVGLILTPSRWWERGYLLVGVVCMAGYIIVVRNRGTSLGLGAAALLSLMFLFKRNSSTAEQADLVPASRAVATPSTGSVRMVVLGLLMLAALVLAGVKVRRGEAFLGVSDEASFSRLNAWSTATRIFFDHPLFGIGVENYPFVSPKYWTDYEKTDFMKENRMSREVHNDYLQIAAETGVMGVGALLLLVSGLLVTTYRVLKRHLGKPTGLMALGVSGGIVTALVQMCFGFSLKVPASLLGFWLLLGMLAFLEREDSGGSARSDNSQNEKWLRVKLPEIGWTKSALRFCAGVAFLAIVLPFRVFFADVHAKAGEDSLRDGLLGDAQFNLETARDLSPKNWRTLSLLGNVHARLHSFDQAESLMKESLELNPGDLQTRIALASVYMSTNMYSKASQEAKKALEILPRYADLRETVALSCIHDKDWQCATEEYSQAIDLGLKDFRLAFMNLAYSYVGLIMDLQSRGEKDKADQLAETTLASLGERLRSQPVDSGLMLALARLRLHTGQPYQGALEAENALALGQQDRKLLDVDIREAKLDLCRFFLNENHPELASQHCADCLGFGDSAEVTSLIARNADMLDALPSGDQPSGLIALAYFNLGHALDVKEKYEQATPLLDKSIALARPGGGMARLYYDLGKTLITREKYAETIPLLKKSLELDLSPTLTGAARLYLGWAYYKLSQFDKAIENLEVASMIAPEQFNVVKALAVAYRESGQKDKAIMTFQRALTLKPNDPEVTQVLGLLTNSAP